MGVVEDSVALAQVRPFTNDRRNSIVYGGMRARTFGLWFADRIFQRDVTRYCVLGTRVVETYRGTVKRPIYVFVVCVRAKGVHVLILKDPCVRRIFVRDAAHDDQTRRFLVYMIWGATA